MSYSFIQPKPKPLIFQDTKIWITFTILALSILLSFNFMLVLQISLAKDDIKLHTFKEVNSKDHISSLKKNIEALHLKVNFAQSITSNNIVIKDSIENLFDLIPKKITLTKIQMSKNALTIQGRTPNKDTYRFLLAVPLKSIFEKSTVSFYLTDNGWYKFISINSFENIKR